MSPVLSYSRMSGASNGNSFYGGLMRYFYRDELFRLLVCSRIKLLLNNVHFQIWLCSTTTIMTGLTACISHKTCSQTINRGLTYTWSLQSFNLKFKYASRFYRVVGHFMDFFKNAKMVTKQDCIFCSFELTRCFHLFAQSPKQKTKCSYSDSCYSSFCTRMVSNNTGIYCEKGNRIFNGRKTIFSAFIFFTEL